MKGEEKKPIKDMAKFLKETIEVILNYIDGKVDYDEFQSAISKARFYIDELDDYFYLKGDRR